jgi:NitT/TauT family transport system permease protein
MSAIAMRPPRERRLVLTRAAGRAASFVVVLAVLWGLWEGYRWLGIRYSITWPFPVDDVTMPPITKIVGALFDPLQPDGPPLIRILLDNVLFTAKEAATGFALGASIGFALGIVLAHSRVLQRGFLPYIIASQTVPILAIAPMVVVWLGSEGLPAWFSVAVIAAYLTFFPVAINTLRGLHAVDARAIELMRSYAASPWSVLWKVRVPSALPYIFAALKVSATASVVGAIIGELPASIQDGLGGAILNFAQYYSFQPQNLWATNLVAAALGIGFFVIVVLAEKLILRRAPERVS